MPSSIHVVYHDLAQWIVLSFLRAHRAVDHAHQVHVHSIAHHVCPCHLQCEELERSHQPQSVDLQRLLKLFVVVWGEQTIELVAARGSIENHSSMQISQF